MKVIKDEISIDELRKMAKRTFGNLVKAVIDVDKEIIVVDGELHSDEEALLLEQNSKQENLWGINLYPDIEGDDWLEFDSMINLRPSLNNLSRGVDNPQTKDKIRAIVNKLIKK